MSKKCPFFGNDCFTDNCMFWQCGIDNCLIVEYFNGQTYNKVKPKKSNRIPKSKGYPSSEVPKEIAKGELTNILKKKSLTEEDIRGICEEFGLPQPDFNNSKDYLFGRIATQLLEKKEGQRFKKYMKKFQDSVGLDYIKLEKQINLSGRQVQ